MRKALFLFALMAFAGLQAKVVYMAPDGSDAAAGTIDAPLATLPAAYQQIASGDTIIAGPSTTAIVLPLTLATPPLSCRQATVTVSRLAAMA